MAFALDPRIARDSQLIVRHASVQIRLQNHAPLPWLVLVPECDATEPFDLEPGQSEALQGCVNRVARTLRRCCRPDKVNIASIGNLVPQLHVHVIGRYVSDPYWPGVVWGHPLEPYADSAAEVALWRRRLDDALSD
ncbi:MAG: HIT family protein [Pseudomonadota bacterium]